MIKRVIGFFMIIMLSFTDGAQVNDKQNNLQPKEIIQQTAPSEFIETDKSVIPVENTKEEPGKVENIKSDNADKTDKTNETDDIEVLLTILFLDN